ncbi:MAG: hypothetical protein LBI18_03280 [Planctomycetaceae bacterium]|jgi:hypothetical protein|nr:hypothetical protein [Planctomycetaceae bacterium]
MPEEIKTPDTINNDDADFLFQQKLFVGTGANQFEVRKRFERNETEINEVKDAQQTANQEKTQINNRIKTLETAKENQDNENQNVAETLLRHAQSIEKNADDLSKHTDNNNIHVSTELRNHPTDATKHLPNGGTPDMVLVTSDTNLPIWKALSELLPPELVQIIEDGGNVTPEQVINAFREITVSQWTSGGLPLGATRIKAAVFAYDRFLVGGSDGRISYTFDAQSWKAAEMLFGEPIPTPVESIVYAKTDDDKTLVLALDAYSDFRISLDRQIWCPRLSIRVNIITTEHGNLYTDRYENADFTCAVADRGLFIIATTSGKVYRATYQQIIEEYERAMLPEYDRHSIVWQMNESQDSITQNTLCAASGGGRFILAGRMGNLAISATAEIFETITTPFGFSNINDIAAGEDRFIAVADDGKIGYALFASPKQWSLIPDHPLTNAGEKIRSVKYGGGIWIAVSNNELTGTARVITSKQGMVWKEVSAHLQNGGTATAFGDTYFIVGDESGNIRRSLSVAGIFSVVTRSEFAALMAQIIGMTQDEIYAMLIEWESIKSEIKEALSYQLTISHQTPKPPSLHGSAGTTEIDVPVLDENGQPVLDENNNPVTTKKPQNKTVALDHDHPDFTLVRLSQLNRATQKSNLEDPYHIHGIPILDDNEKLLAKNQTWQRGQANGIAPLDANCLIPEEFLSDGWDYDRLILALRNEMLVTWTIQKNDIFQDLSEFSRLNAFAYNETTIVAVGEKGRIAWGPNTGLMQMVTMSPFGENDSVVGIAHGTRADGTDIFIAVSQTQYSTSLNGSEWTEAVDLSDGIQGIFFGGGFFLVPDVHGNIWRSSWNDNVLSFHRQESSQNVTMGIMSIAYLQNKFVGVGTNNRIVGTTDPAYWNEEQSPAPSDTQWNCVFTGDGFFVAIGKYGRALKGTVAGNWSPFSTGTTSDLHIGFFDFSTYLIAGKNGTLRTSTNADSWVGRDTKTTSTIRAAGFVFSNERFFIGTDAGQFIVSRSVSDVLFVGNMKAGVGPSNTEPNPLGDLPYPGESNQYLRADAVIPDRGVVMEKRVGVPTTYKIVDDQEVVDRYGVPPLNRDAQIPDQFIRWLIGIATEYHNSIDPDTGITTKTPVRWGLPYLDENIKIPEQFMAWARGLPNGVAPLDNENFVPKEHLPPTEINIEQVVNVIKGGQGLEFLEQISPFQQGFGVSTVIHDGCYGNDVHVFVGEAGIAYSDNNGNWTLSDTQPFGNIPVVGVAFGVDDNENNIFVSIDKTKRYSTSRDGKAWDYIYNMKDNYDFEAIAYYNRTFLILCSDGEILHSSFKNGNISFTDQADSPNITAQCNDIEGGNDIVVTVGNGGKICISDDASHFMDAVSPTTEDLLTVTFAKGTFLIGGDNNTLITGTDGTDFERIVSPFSGNAHITGTGYDSQNGIFIVTNSNGQIATSSNLIDWTNHLPQPTIVRIKAIATGNNRIVLGDDSGNIFASRISLEINYPGISDDYVKKAYVNAKFQQAIEIATGARIGIVFDSTEQLDDWIESDYTRPDGITPADLKIGESIYIIETNEPDYWWDGTTYQEQETKTVLDLSDYATKEDVENAIKAIDLGEANNVWVGGNFEKNSDGTYSAQLLNTSGVPAGEYLHNLIPIQSPDEIEIGDSGGGKGGGFRYIYIDVDNGNDNNSGLTSETAFQTWDKCVAVLDNVTSAHIVLTGFTHGTETLYLDNNKGISLIIENDITVETLHFVGLLSVQFRGNITANSIRFTNNNNIRFFEAVTLNAVEECPILFYNESCNIYFEKLVTATATNGEYATEFVKVQDLSVTKFRELVIEDTGLNENTEYYGIETGSEVYVNGKAKHPNPYTAIELDPNTYNFPTL